MKRKDSLELTLERSEDWSLPLAVSILYRHAIPQDFNVTQQPPDFVPENRAKWALEVD